MKIKSEEMEDFHSVLQFRVLAFLTSGFSGFPNIGPEMRVLIKGDIDLLQVYSKIYQH